MSGLTISVCRPRESSELRIVLSVYRVRVRELLPPKKMMSTDMEVSDQKMGGGGAGTRKQKRAPGPLSAASPDSNAEALMCDSCEA